MRAKRSPFEAIGAQTARCHVIPDRRKKKDLDTADWINIGHLETHMLIVALEMTIRASI
jgi:hypothetical protein